MAKGSSSVGRKFADGLMTLPAVVDDSPSPRDAPAQSGAVPRSPHLSLGRMVETNGGGALEPVPGFAAKRARNAGLFSAVSYAPVSTDANGFIRENVIGDDNLVSIPDTTAVPWRCIAMLTITYEDGVKGTGTAWFLSERALGTAGHNIHDPEHGHATEILVAPGYDGVTALFGTYRVHQTYCDPAWLNGNEDPSLDFGVLLLDDSTAGQRLGWFGFAAYDDSQLTRLLLNVSGYPIDHATRTQYYNGGRLEQVDKTFLRYTFDTSGGMSGAPIFGLFGQQRIVVGIHTSGNSRANRARRIDKKLAQLFSSLAHG